MIDKKKVRSAITLLIDALGYDINDQNFRETPRRVADMFEEILEGNKYEEEPVHFVQSSNLVIVGGIRTYGFCPHHLLPISFEGEVAYLPEKEVVGLSKLVRVTVDCTSKLIMQEEATEEIADKIQEITGSQDVMVVLKGQHLCMQMRGVKCREGYVVTSAVRGRFESEQALRMETLRLMGRR